MFWATSCKDRSLLWRLHHEGFISADNANHRWPDDLAQRLASAGLKIGSTEEGIAGNRFALQRMGRSAEARFMATLLSNRVFGG